MDSFLVPCRGCLVESPTLIPLQVSHESSNPLLCLVEAQTSDLILADGT